MHSRFTRWTRRFVGAAALVLVGLLLACGIGFAQEGPDTRAGNPVVGRILVAGNVHVDSARIVRTFDVPPGTRFSSDLVRRGTRKLTALGLFSNVQLLKNEHDGVVDITIVVAERPRLAGIRFSGNKKREDVDLEKKLFLRRGETYSYTQVQLQVDSLAEYYRSEGFPRAKISPKVDTLAATNEVDLTFQVVEGEKLRIGDIVFEGRTAFPPKKLRKVMKTKTKGLFGGGDLKDETFPEDREKLEEWYHNHGYRDMTVTGFEVLPPGKDPKRVTLRVSLAEGRRYRFGPVTWDGARTLDSTFLARTWNAKKAGLYDRSRIEKARGDVLGEYAEHGLLYVDLEPEEIVSDSTVELAFHVREGSPSLVRRVTILGNKGTRENVLRRELDVHEGDRFRRSALIRSQGDLMRLQLFEEVMPDISPAESTDVDVVFRVKEKQVGTASAGAGYTGEAGLTGFLELGHTNVLGNGQSLALHLERGGRSDRRREDYSLSFTEPWFKDSPTLLGYSLYSTTRELLEYDQRRRGASARIGRPLPWPDYSRGSLSYTFESMRISNVDTSLTIAGVSTNTDILTSTLEFNFLRNSTDNPFYPTKGTRLTVNEEFTGGPFGGELHYHRHRYEGRAYVPSVLKSVTTMMRLRVGTVGSYTWRHDVIPDYAKFRLGGGNTVDPLRGYMDYQVVPDRGNYWYRYNYVDSLGGYTDSTLTRRRYPGGRYMALATIEQQFPIVHPLHALLFVDAGNVWDERKYIKPFDLKVGAGFGLRMEIPILGNVGFDYGYGFNRDDGARWQGHFLLGNVGF
ncbi:MAG: outer membrane protein assembly factor BamA [Candidatus Eisenbacteria bacterium]